MPHSCLAFWALAGAVLISDASTARSGVAAPSVEELLGIEKRIVDARRGLLSGRVVVTIRHGSLPQDQGRSGEAKRYTIFFSGDKARADLDRPGAPARGVSHTVLTKDMFIRAAASDEWVDVFGQHSRPTSTLEIPDPRRLGLVAWFFETINQMGLEQYLLRPNRDELRVASELHKGKPIWKVAYRVKLPKGTVSTEYWLDPENPELPIHIASWSGEGDKRYWQSIDSTLARFPNGDVCYPKEVVFRSGQGDATEVQEIAAVEEAEFGQAINDQTFALAGLGLAKGRVIDLDGKLMLWTGDGMIPKPHELDVYEADEIVQTTNPRRWLLMINALVLAAAAAGLLWRRWRAR